MENSQMKISERIARLAEASTNEHVQAELETIEILVKQLELENNGLTQQLQETTIQCERWHNLVLGK